MLRRRKVLTRNQYEKRRRRHLFVESVCDASPPKQSSNRGPVPLPSPASNPFLKADEALEIYNGNHKSHKRGRPRGNNPLHSPMEASLCSSSKSSCTYSDAASHVLSDDVFSNEGTAPSIQSYESVGDVISPAGKRNIRGKPFTVEMTRVSVNISRHADDQAFHRKNIHTEKAKALNGVGARVSEFLWCCGNSLFSTTKPTTSNIVQRPGISFLEERKLRHSTKKRNSRNSRLPVSSSNMSDSKEIDQIEVIPVDERFQSSGSVGYAEMEKTGMVFAPNAAIDPVRSNPSLLPLPWWKRDKWTSSPLGDGFDSQDVSQGRTSAHTKKISNRHSSNTLQTKELHDSSICVIREDNTPLDRGRSPINRRPRVLDVDQQSTSACNVALRFNDAEAVRPFQVFNPKVEESKKLRKYNRRDDVSDGSISFTESLDIGRNYSNRIHHDQAPAVVETIGPENGSEIESETDLSELIRKRDISQGDSPMIVRLHTDPIPSADDENDAVFHILAASTVPIDLSMKKDTAVRHACERDISNVNEQSRDRHRANISARNERNEPYFEMDDEIAPVRRPSDPMQMKRAVNLSPPRCLYSKPLTSGRNNVRSRPIHTFQENPRHPCEKCGKNDFIDLTDHGEPYVSTRKRSKSPIRLYGDPPFPYRMDGSPVRGRRSCFWSEAPAVDEDIFDKELLEQLDAFESLQNITSRKDDAPDMTGARGPNNNALLDGSRIVMLKPIVNVYKIETMDRQRDLEVCKKLRHDRSPTRSLSKKVDLQIKTVFSDRENAFETNNDEPAVEIYSSPVITVSLEDDERSVDEELRMLAASEKLLRKELEEIQKRSAERRWQIEVEATAENDKSSHRRSAVDAMPDFKSFGSPSISTNVAPSVIDVSCIDLDFDQSQSLVSSLPIASAYREPNKNENVDFLPHVPCFPSSKNENNKMDLLNDEEVRKLSVVDSKPEIQPTMGLSSACTSPENMPLTSGFREEDNSSKWMHSNNRDILYVPSLLNHIHDVTPGMEERKDDSIFSGISQDEVFSRSLHIHGDIKPAEPDVLIDKDVSWRVIEDLYLLAHRGDISEERDISVLRKQASKEFPMSLFSSRAANFTKPLALSSAQAADPNETLESEDIGDNKASIADFTALDTYNAEQSLYASLLHLSPRTISSKVKSHEISQTFRGPDSSPRLQSLLHRHKHLMMGGSSASTSAVLGNQLNTEKKDVQPQGIYGELVRRRRLNNRISITTDSSLSLSMNESGLRDSDINANSTFAGNRLAKRLERQKKLHMEMQARRRAENHLSMRLSPARRRASKSLRGNHVRNMFTEHATPIGTKNMIKLTSIVQQPGVKRRSNTEALVQLYMPVTGKSEREFLKKKKGSDHNSRDLLSIASSTRSKDLVQSLPSIAKTRNAAAGKPGSLLWEATAGREP